MNVRPIITELRRERGRLDEAILALEGLSAVPGNGRLALQVVRGDSASAQTERTAYPTGGMAAAR